MYEFFAKEEYIIFVILYRMCLFSQRGVDNIY